MEISTPDYSFLVKEWQSLVGGKIQKIYIKDRTHVIQIYNKAHYNLLLTDKAAFLTTSKLNYPQKPSGYCTFLRRRLHNARIKKVEQRGWDRIISLTIETLEGEVEFIAELLGEINTLLVKDGKIISLFETHSYADRTVRGGAPYEPPPAKTLPNQVLAENLLNQSAAKTIAKEWSVGGKWAEEICSRSSVEKEEKINENNLKTMRAEFEKMLQSDITAVYGSGYALPIPFKTLPQASVSAASFNEAIDKILSPTFITEQTKDENKEIKKQVTKQEKILKAQRERLALMEQAATNEQRKGELIYENYSELHTLLKDLKEDWKKMSLGEIRDKYGNRPFVKQINEDGTIELEMGE